MLWDLCAIQAPFGKFHKGKGIIAQIMVSQKSREAKRSQWNDSITIKANLYSLCSSALFPFPNWLSLPLLIVFIFLWLFLCGTYMPAAALTL